MVMDMRVRKRRCAAGLTPQEILQSNTAEWMMVSSSLVDLTGTQCNMVGTSYAGFRYQPVRCRPTHLVHVTYRHAIFAMHTSEQGLNASRIPNAICVYS
jgi:hypothetical protein